MELNIKLEDWKAMHRHVQACAPLEACGLLVGKNNAVEKVFPIENEAKSRVRFRMNPKEQLQVFDWIESNGLELIGIFHSHPTRPETVSATDIEEAAYPAVQIVWSRTNGGWAARGFWIDGQQASEVNLNIMKGE